jgi:putative transposase
VKFALIASENASFGISKLCRALGVSRSGYYAWRTRPECARKRDDTLFRVLIKEAYLQSDGVYGRPRLHRALKNAGYVIGHKRVARLMATENLRAKVKRKFRSATNSDHGLPTALNILDRNFDPVAPNQVWAGDTTELRTANGGRFFLAIVLDLYSRFAVGWAISAINDNKLVRSALEMALKRRSPPMGLLHHSDQGSPYASESYQTLLTENAIICSMSRRGNCWDNAVVESFFATLKRELGEVFENAGVAKAALFRYLEIFYNQQRLHSSIGYRSPAEHEKLGPMIHQVAA